MLNYARAHNSLWLHTEVSSMNNLMIPLSLGGEPKRTALVYPQVPATNHPDVCLNNHLKLTIN